VLAGRRSRNRAWVVYEILSSMMEKVDSCSPAAAAEREPRHSAPHTARTTDDACMVYMPPGKCRRYLRAVIPPLYMHYGPGSHRRTLLAVSTFLAAR